MYLIFLIKKIKEKGNWLKSFSFYGKKNRATILTERRVKLLNFPFILSKLLNCIQNDVNLMPYLVNFKPT